MLKKRANSHQLENRSSTPVVYYFSRHQKVGNARYNSPANSSPKFSDSVAVAPNPDAAEKKRELAAKLQ